MLVRGDVTTFPGRQIIPPASLEAALRIAPNFALIHVAGPLALFATVSSTTPSLAVAQTFATIDSTTPDLRTLSFLPFGTDLVSAPPVLGAMRLSQIPPLSSWDVGTGQLSISVPEPLGWQYKLGELDGNGTSLLVDPLAPPSAQSPFVAVASADQARTQATLTVKLPLGKSLIADGAFKDGPWQVDAGNCSNTGSLPAGQRDASVISDGPNGLPALQLSATAHSACEARDIAWSGGQLLVHLWTRHVSGGAPRFCVFEFGPNRCSPATTVSQTSDWEQQTIVVTPDSGTSALGLFVYADANQFGPPTVNDYADIAVYSVPSTELVLVGDPAVTTGGPTIQLLVLRESYSENWSGPSRSQHVLVDGMMNGWLLAQPGAGLSVTYTPTGLVTFGLLVSGAGLIGILILVVTLFPLKDCWALIGRR